MVVRIHSLVVEIETQSQTSYINRCHTLISPRTGRFATFGREASGWAFSPGATRAPQGSNQGFHLSPTKNLRSDIQFLLTSDLMFNIHVEIGHLFNLFLRSDISSF